MEKIRISPVLFHRFVSCPFTTFLKLLPFKDTRSFPAAKSNYLHFSPHSVCPLCCISKSTTLLLETSRFLAVSEATLSSSLPTFFFLSFWFWGSSIAGISWNARSIAESSGELVQLVIREGSQEKKTKANTVETQKPRRGCARSCNRPRAKNQELEIATKVTADKKTGEIPNVIQPCLPDILFIFTWHYFYRQGT